MTEREGNHGNFFGVLLILIGVFFIAGNIWEDTIGELITVWWPSLLILFGIRLALLGNGLFSPVFLLFFGVAFLLRNLEIVDVIESEFLIPALLILIGLAMVFRPKRGSKEIAPEVITDCPGEVTAVFGKDRRVFQGQLHGKQSLTGVFGKVYGDFSGCTLAPGGASIEVTAVFGKASLRIPANWTVKITSNAVMGEVVDRRNMSGDGEQTEDVLLLEANGIFGTVELTN
jgi:predicted membrane protein